MRSAPDTNRMCLHGSIEQTVASQREIPGPILGDAALMHAHAQSHYHTS